VILPRAVTMDDDKPKNDSLVSRYEGISNEHGSGIEDPIEFSTTPGAFRAEPGNRLVPASAEGLAHASSTVVSSTHASIHRALNRSHDEFIVVDAALVQSNGSTRNAGSAGGGRAKLVRAQLHRPELRSLRLTLSIVAVLALLVGLAIGLWLGLSRSTVDRTQGASPSFAPTMAPVRSQWIEQADLFPSTQKALKVSNSPQMRALTWVLENAIEGGGSASGSQTPLEREKQRFALAAMYYGLDGPESGLADEWLNSDVHECDWTGVTCSNEIVESLQLLGNQRLQGLVAPEVGLLTALARLTINGVSGLKHGIPSELGYNRLITSLSLARNGLTGRIPSELGRLNNLVALDFSKNRLAGTIPTEFSSLSSLRSIKLYENALAGPLLSVSNMKSLTCLNLYQNGLSGTVPAEIAELAHLEKLHLSTNQLTGTIPTVLGLLRNLTFFSLRGNQGLSGTVPSDLGQLSNLNSLYIFTTRITGPVPTELFALPELRDLRLNDNQLSGSIPPHVGNWTSARLLHLHGNRFRGSIPTAWSGLSDLRELQVNDNDLSGSVPSGLAALSRLTVLLLQHNRNLTGRIPPELCQLAIANGVNVTVDCENVKFNKSSCPGLCAAGLI
jgi:Leucine-rich repeat (LRR) protein